MSRRTYTYDPSKVIEQGKDKMRFELGDTMVEGGSDTTALTDEEIQAAIDTYPKHWKRAKLMLLESICRRFSYEVDTRTGPLTLSFQERAKMWHEDCEALKKEISATNCKVSGMKKGRNNKPPYFYTGMQQNKRQF